MELKIIKSQLDGDYSPQEQYLWNLKNGFQPKVDHQKIFLNVDKAKNEELNNQLIVEINQLVKFILGIIKSDIEFDYDDFIESCEKIKTFFSSIVNYSKKSVQAIIQLLNTIVKLDTSNKTENLIDLGEILWDDCLYVLLKAPNCPRPVLWHIPTIEDKINWLAVDLGNVPALAWSYCDNWVIGDNFFKNNKPTTVGSFFLTMNPSVTIKTLKYVEPIYVYEMGSTARELVFTFLSAIPASFYTVNTDGSYTFQSKNFGESAVTSSLNISDLISKYNFESNIFGESDGEMSTVGDFYIFTSRMILEIKFGRATLRNLIKSNNQYIRTFLYHHPNLDIGEKKILESKGIYHIDDAFLPLISEHLIINQ